MHNKHSSIQPKLRQFIIIEGASAKAEFDPLGIKARQRIIKRHRRIIENNINRYGKLKVVR